MLRRRILLAVKRQSKQTKLLTLLIVGVLGIGAVVAGVAHGAPAVSSNSATINSSVYRAGRNVNVTGVINGDVFCAGQTVTVDAQVNGDVLCAGQTVNVSGKVNGNVRVAGQTVTLGADVTRSASVVGQDVTIESGAKVGRDLSLATQTTTINGHVNRDLSAATNDLVLNSTVGRNVDATVAKLELQNSADIKGKLNYSSQSQSDLHRSSGAKVGGAVSYHHINKNNNRGGMWHRTMWAGRAYMEISLIIFALVLAALFPQLFDGWNQVARRRFWLSLLVGFLAMFIVPAVIIALFVSVIGVPLALLLILVWLTIIALSAPVAAYYIGSLIMHGGTSIPLVMLLGAVILAILCLIPWLGWLVTIVAYWFGTGALLINLRQSFARPDYRASPEPNA